MSGTPGSQSDGHPGVTSVMGCVSVGTWEVDEHKVALDEGHAEQMGGGMFIVFQEVEGITQAVTLSRDDLEAMLAVA